MDMSSDNDEQIQVIDDRKGNCREIQVLKFCNGDYF